MLRKKVEGHDRRPLRAPESTETTLIKIQAPQGLDGLNLPMNSCGRRGILKILAGI